jgi:Zn-dependent metalloprotease
MKRTHYLYYIMALSLFLYVLLPCGVAVAMPLESVEQPQAVAAQSSSFDVSIAGVHTLQNAPSMSFATRSAQDPRAVHLAAWLQDRIAADHPQASRLTKAQADALAALRTRLGTAVKVRVQDGIPRMMKAAALQHALQNFAPGRNGAWETAWAFLHANKAILRLELPDQELVLQRSNRDALGYHHIRFAQTFQGLSIWPKGDLVVHLNAAGDVYMMNGIYIPTPRALQMIPTLSADDALARAREVVPWGANTASSSPELIIYTPDAGAPHLAWRMDVAVSLSALWRVVIDAHTGSTLTAFNRVMTQNQPGSGIDVFGTTRAINVWQDGDLFFLVDTSKPMFDPTSNPPNPSETRGAIGIQDAQNQPPNDDPEELPPLVDITSNSATSGWLADGISAIYGFSETYDYYLERHGRNSLDGRGGQILAAVRLGLNFRNAFFHSGLQMMFFGDALPFAGALDVVGHELTHGVIDNSAGLVYQDQSGALNEAYADIFGEMVEARTNGRPDWVLGAQLRQPARSLIDPSSIEICCGRHYPSKMSEFVTLDDPDLGERLRGDNGGVHINSSIINHAFYQLAEGLNGAIGIRDAELIFYRALTTQLVPSSQFLDARLACIQSAEELFGADSVQAVKTGEAFDAVEIFDGTPPPGPVPGPGIDGPDATIFAALAPVSAASTAWFLARRETDFGDRPEGVFISRFDIQPKRPAVTGDGQVVFFVDSIHDLCAMPTDGSVAEACLGNPGTIHSVALSPSSQFAAVVLLDTSGHPDNQILLLDLVNETSRELPLLAPTQDGIPIGTVLFADAMDFTSDDRFLFYDALNAVTLSDGTQLQLWSLFAIDLVNNVTLVIVPPIPGLNVGNPAVGQTSDVLLTFERFDTMTGLSDIFAGNLNSGDTFIVGQVQDTLGFPSYNGGDQIIVYTVSDPSVLTGLSLVQQPLAEDRITPVGAPQGWLSNGALGVIYRRVSGAALTLE